jgi:hypothetical protein
MKRLLLAASFGLLSCSSTPPADWARGGAIVDIPYARWVRGDVTVDIQPDGKIFIDKDHTYTIDRAGRLYDIDQQPVALLEPDGSIVGPGNTPLGQVGSLYAARPGEATAWLTVTPAGEVIRYDQEGERITMGAWVGQCARSASAHEVCVFISHLLGTKFVEEQRRRPGQPSYVPGVGFTPGAGVGIGIGH